MNLAFNNKIKHISINNISFSPGKTQQKGTNDMKLISFKNDLIKEQMMMNKVKPKHSGITRNSFIPTGHIRTNCSYEKQRKSYEKPIRPASVTHSKFPGRKPLSAKTAKSLIPIYRERLFSFATTQQVNIDRISLRVSAKTQQMRATTASCLTLTKKSIEHELAPRYAHTVKASRRLRKKTHDDQWDQLEKMGF